MKASVDQIQTVYGLQGLGDQGICLNVNPDTGGCDSWEYPTGTPISTTYAPTTSSPTFAQTISTLTNSFTSIFKAISPIPAGCQSVAGPYGTSLACAGAGNGLATQSLLSSSSSSTYLLIGGAVLIGFLMMKK
jgi:hypothetical protein